MFKNGGDYNVEEFEKNVLKKKRRMSNRLYMEYKL